MPESAAQDFADSIGQRVARAQREADTTLAEAAITGIVRDELVNLALMEMAEEVIAEAETVTVLRECRATFAAIGGARADVLKHAIIDKIDAALAKAAPASASAMMPICVAPEYFGLPAHGKPFLLVAFRNVLESEIVYTFPIAADIGSAVAGSWHVLTGASVFLVTPDAEA